MNVTLYKYDGEIKKLHKNFTGYVEDEDKKTLTNVYLKDGSSVTHPSLLITSIDELSEFNYCYIPVWNRYYFMEVDSITNRLWEFKCSVDALNSNKDAIDLNYAYIERSESLGNVLLEDDSVSFENQNTITITNLSSQTQGNLINTSLVQGITQSSKNITLSTINNKNMQPVKINDDGTLVYTTTITAPITNMSDVVIPFNNGEFYYNFIYIFDYNRLNSVKTIYQEVKSTFIKSLIVWPFGLSALTYKDSNGVIQFYEEPFSLGSEVQGTNAFFPSYDAYKYYTFLDYTFPSVSNFNDYEPYTTYELYIPYVGWKVINIRDVEGSRILLSMRLNFESGEGIIYLINYTKNYIIASYDAQIGVVVPISRSNLEEKNAQQFSNIIGMTLGVMGGAMTSAFGMVSANPVAVAGGALAISSSVAKGIQSNLSLFEKGQVQIKSANNGLDSRKVLLKVTSKNKIASPSSQMGTPVRKVDLISNCSGFTIAKINKLSGLEYASKWEYDEIVRLFQEGIII